MFPFDLVVTVENAELSSLYLIQLSEFRADIEVRSAEPDDWTLNDVLVQRADGEWVREPFLEAACTSALYSATGMKAVEAAIVSRLEDMRSFRMAAE